jgi:methionine aminopeptidase
MLTHHYCSNLLPFNNLSITYAYCGTCDKVAVTKENSVVYQEDSVTNLVNLDIEVVHKNPIEDKPLEPSKLMANEPFINRVVDDIKEVASNISETVAGHVLEQATDWTESFAIGKELPINKVVDISEEVIQDYLLAGTDIVSFTELEPDKVEILSTWTTTCSLRTKTAAARHVILWTKKLTELRILSINAQKKLLKSMRTKKCSWPRTCLRRHPTPKWMRST